MKLCATKDATCPEAWSAFERVMAQSQAVLD